MKNDPIKQLLDLAEDFLAAQKVTAKKVPADVLEDLRHRMFGDPAPIRLLIGKKADSLLLMLINRRESTALELINALGKENTSFGEGESAIIGVLRKLEMLGYVCGEEKERAGKTQRVYRTTDDGDKLVNASKSKVDDLLPLFEKLSITLGPVQN